MKTKIISSKILNISPSSATIAVADKANELKSRGINVISFAKGEPISILQKILKTLQIKR